jgi:hypothetical protein
MTTVTLPTEATPPGSPDTAPWLPLTGHYAVAPGRSLVELTAFYGPLPVRRRRLALAEASLTVSEGTEHPTLGFEFTGPHLTGALTLDHARPTAGAVQLTGDLRIDGTDFPVLLRLRVVERTDERLLAVGTARLPYRLLRRATGFRFGRLRPATRLRLLLAAEFA